MEKENIEKQSFVMYNSFIDAATNLDDAHFKECIIKIRDYALYGKDEDSDFWGVNVIMDIAKPLLDAAKKRYERCVENGKKGGEHGKKGGRPKKETNPPEKPQEEPLNVYENDYEYEKDNVKEKVYENPYGNAKENNSLCENGSVVSGQNITIMSEFDSFANQNQSKDENHLQVEDDFISSQETEDNHIGSSNSCLSIQKSNENDGFMDALFEFQDLDG